MDASSFLRQQLEMRLKLTFVSSLVPQVLMDIEMPVMDGLTAIRKIREMEAKGEIEVRQTGELSSLSFSRPSFSNRPL